VRSTLLLYSTKPRYDRWVKYLLGGTVAFTLILGIVLIPVEIEGAWVCFAATVFDGLLFWVIMPHSLQIYEDRVRIKLGGPFAVNIALANIREAKKGSTGDALAYGGVRFATSLRNVVIIVRRRGWNIVISPDDADMFIEQLNQAQQALPAGEPAVN